MKGTDVNSFEVRKLIGEYDFVVKQLYQIEDAKPFLLDFAKNCKINAGKAAEIDSAYEAGSAKYITDAIEAFYSY